MESLFVVLMIIFAIGVVLAIESKYITGKSKYTTEDNIKASDKYKKACNKYLKASDKYKEASDKYKEACIKYKEAYDTYVNSNKEISAYRKLEAARNSYKFYKNNFIRKSEAYQKASKKFGKILNKKKS